MCGIYLDYQSASPVDPRVAEFAERYLSSDFGNPSALHSRGLAAKAVEFDVPLGQNGDCYDRYLVRIEEMRQSLRILEQAAKGFPAGQYRCKEKPVIKPPAGSYFASVETARGMNCTYFVSDGGVKPYRIKTRSPGYSNLSAMNEMSAGCKIADVVAILSTLDLIIPDIDR